MPSEANKIRNQCAKKYGVREKAYKERIAALETQVSSLETALSDYDAMKKAYVKMLIVSKLSESERETLLRSQKFDDMIKKAGIMSDVSSSMDLSGLAKSLMGLSSLSLDSCMMVLEGYARAKRTENLAKTAIAGTDVSEDAANDEGFGSAYGG